VSVPFNTTQFQALPARRIPLADIASSQVYVDESKIERMRKTWSADMAPPVVAERHGRYTVLDGHHRVEAARRRGHTYLRARISE
jgi:ParB-like chromosome segregation protein Spo0J